MDTMTTRKILTISLPPSIEKQVTKLAREEEKTKSELLRDAFRQYSLQKRLAKVFRYGEKTAVRLGIESYDDIENRGG